MFYEVNYSQLQAVIIKHTIYFTPNQLQHLFSASTCLIFYFITNFYALFAKISFLSDGGVARHDINFVYPT